ncbi:acid protease [Mycena amicta]|nr:acid protease [Mycena amicta]
MVFRALTPAFLLFAGAATAASIDLLPSTHAAHHQLAPFSAPIVSKVPRRSSKAEALHSLRSQGGAPHTAVLWGADYDYEYLTNITIDKQIFTVIVDTGSSDTWVAQKGFQCLNLTGHPEPQATCRFGSQGFDTQDTTSFQTYPNTKFSVAYGDGEFLSGTAGKATVSVAGLAVTNQVFGLVTKAAWQGDGINAGLLGLAYPTLTSLKSASHNQQIIYSPFFFTAVQEKKISETYFSLALNRGTNAGKHSPDIDPYLGYVAFGGRPPVDVVQSSTVTVPLQGFTAGRRTPVSASSHTPASYFYYAIDVESYIFPNSSGIPTASNSTIIDSGTTLNLLPSPVAQAYNARWKTANWHDGSWYVDCDEVAPPFAVEIGDKTFTIDPRDQVVYVGKDDDGKDLCVSGTQDGGDPNVDGTMFILGDVFLHNVVAMFDIHKNQMTFIQRADY